MTKSVEIKVSREDTKVALAEILQECERVRKEYAQALDNFDTPLEQIESEYQRQIHRLISIGKEDSSLSRELGRMEWTLSNGPLFEGYLKGKEWSVREIEEKYPFVKKFSSSGNITVIYDIYNALLYESSLPMDAPFPLLHTEASLRDFGHGHRLYEVPLLRNGRRLLSTHYPDSSRITKINNILSEEFKLCPHGIYLLIPQSAEVSGASFVKNAGVTFTCSDVGETGKLYLVKNSQISFPKCSYSYFLFGTDLGNLLKKFLPGGLTAEYITENLKSLENPFHSHDKINFNENMGFLFALQGQDRIGFEFGGEKYCLERTGKAQK